MARVAAGDAKEHVDIVLLKDEQGGLMMEAGITTISFFRGAIKPAAEALRAQLGLVVAANPWLAGRLVKVGGGVCLRHPASPTASDVDELFTAAAGDAVAFKLSPASSYMKICGDMFKSKKVIVGAGSALVNKDLPVALLTLSEAAPGEFALVFSVSHAVGDGRTYYEVFKMLQPGAAVRALTAARVMAFSEAMRDVCGRKEMAWADSTSTSCLVMLSMLFQKKAQCFAWNLDSARVAAAKSAAAQDGHVSYVSTNDILTSAFFSECRTRVGMMGLDCRERIEGIGKDLAGNYVSALTMDPATFGTPAAVRKMLSSTPSSFAGNIIQLEGCELVVHLPVQNPDYCVYDLMIPFASGVGKTGVICWTVSSTEQGLRKALPVGECVSPELFP